WRVRAPRVGRALVEATWLLAAGIGASAVRPARLWPARAAESLRTRPRLSGRVRPGRVRVARVLALHVRVLRMVWLARGMGGLPVRDRRGLALLIGSLGASAGCGT